MASRDSLEIRRLSARGAVVVTRDDTPIVLRIRKVGTESATSVTIISATSIALVGSVTTDTFLFATYTTVGALADVINSTGRWECVVLDALRSDVTSSSNLLPNSAITAGTDGNGVVVWDVLSDDSVNKSITATLSLHRDFDYPKRGHVIELQEIVYNVDVNGASANSVRIYQRVGAVETQIFGQASVDVTKTTINFASGVGTITGADNADLIVRVQDATSVSDTTNNFLQVTGLLK